MDALSTPVSSLRASGGGSAALLSGQLRDTHLLKPPSTLSGTKPHLLPTSSLSRQPLSHPRPLLHLSPPRSRPLLITPAAARNPPAVHRRASTGYAAALLDAARCDSVLGPLEWDVRRFKKAVGAVLDDTLIGEERKGRVVKGVAEGGGFDRRLVALVRMLVGKKKVGVVGEVMEEFGRICDELNGTQTVVVSSEKRMGEAALAGIAKEVQRASGAAKVKVRHLFREGQLMFPAA